MKKLIAAVVGIGSLTLLLLSLAIISMLVMNSAWQNSLAELQAERDDDGSVGGNLLVWLDNRPWAEAVIEAFNRHYPNVNVRLEISGNVENRARVSLDGPAGIGPDVFLMVHDHMMNAIIDDIAMPFPPEMHQRFAEILLEPAILTCTYEGELFAVPISTETIAFFYNIDLLDGRDVPRTFEEVIEFAVSWNNPAANRFALRWQVANPYDNYFFLTAFGMELFGPNMDDFRYPDFDSEAVRQGLAFHNSLRAIFPLNTADATWDATVAAFQRGEVPFTITGPWAIADAVRNGVNFGTTKLPTINGVQPRAFSGNVVAAVSSFTRNARAAFAFVNFLASVEGMTIQFEQTGRLTTFRDISLIEGLADDPHLMGIMAQASYTDPMPVIPEVNMMWEPMGTLFTFTWDGLLSIEEAQNIAMRDYDLALLMAGRSRHWSAQ